MAKVILNAGFDVRMVKQPAVLPDVAPGEIQRPASGIPQDWRAVPLERILTPEQVQRTGEIIALNKHNPVEQFRQLKRYFQTLQTELEKQEIDPQYLAWTIYATVNKVPENTSTLPD